MSGWEIAGLSLLVGLKLAWFVFAVRTIDAGSELWYRQECRRHGIDPGPLPKRFR